MKLINILTLLYNIRMGAHYENVGFEDALETIPTLTRKLNRRVWVDPAVLESALWSCNIMQENGTFWDVKGRTFEQFLNDEFKRDTFNLRYHLIERRRDRK